MRHAGRAMDLARQTLGLDLEAAFIDTLRRAGTNDPEYVTGADVYEARVRPRAFDLARIGAGAALYALFDLEPPAVASGMYAVDGDWRYRSDAGGLRRVLGTVRVRSRATGEEALFDAAALFSGMDRVAVGVREDGGEEALRAAWEGVMGADPAGAVSGSFARVYTAPDLSDEERWAIARRIAPGIGEAICGVYQDAAPLLSVLEDLGIPETGGAALLREHASSERLRSLIEAGCPDPDGFLALARDVMAPVLVALGAAASRRIEASAGAAASRPGNPAPLEEIVRMVGCAKGAGLPLTLWEAQNLCIEMRKNYVVMEERAGRGDRDAERWTEVFREAARCLGVRVA